MDKHDKGMFNPEVEEMIDTEVKEVSIVDFPATDRELLLFKSQSAGSKPAAVEACVQALLDDPDFRAQSGQSREESAWAICNAQNRRGPMKQDEVPAVMPMVEPPPPTLEVVEVPASPETLKVTDCIEAATGMGFSTDDAVEICRMIRADFGDPTDEEIILIPEGVDLEGLISTAAVQMGIAKPEGMPEPEQPEQPEEEVVEGELRFRGENRWLKLFNRFLGRDKPKPKTMTELTEEVTNLTATQESMKDLLAINAKILQKISDTFPEKETPPDPPPPEETPPTPPEETPPETPTEEPATEKTPPADDAKSEIERLKSILEAHGISWEEETEETEEVLEETPPAEPERKSVDPDSGNGRRGGLVYSSILGINIPKKDRDLMATQPVPARGR